MTPPPQQVGRMQQHPAHLLWQNPMVLLDSTTERRGGRVVEGNSLENRQRASVRGFESHPLRCPVTRAARKEGSLEEGKEYQCASCLTPWGLGYLKRSDSLPPHGIFSRHKKVNLLGSAVDEQTLC